MLPFANFSGDPEQEFFADGITEDIISMLAGWRAFPVIARNSTFNYKGQTVDIKKVGEELGVRYVLEGSVRKSGHRVRVTAQLIRADTNHHIMAERYDRDLTDLFELQDEIVTAIAGAIEPELLKFERERIAERPQHSEDAYELYQRGMWHHYRQNKADNIEAQDYFRRALAIDPQYPQATAALAIAVCNAAYLGWADDPEPELRGSIRAWRNRRSASTRRYPNAHFALGLVCMWTAVPIAAIAAFQEAIKLNPELCRRSRSTRADVPLLRPARRGDRRWLKRASASAPAIRACSSGCPRWPARIISAGNYEKAVEIGRRGWALNRNWPACLRYVVAGLAQLGRIEEAQAALVDLKTLDPNLAFVEGILTRLYTERAGVDHFLEGLRKAGFRIGLPGRPRDAKRPAGAHFLSDCGAELSTRIAVLSIGGRRVGAGGGRGVHGRLPGVPAKPTGISGFIAKLTICEFEYSDEMSEHEL